MLLVLTAGYLLILWVIYSYCSCMKHWAKQSATGFVHIYSCSLYRLPKYVRVNHWNVKTAEWRKVLPCLCTLQLSLSASVFGCSNENSSSWSEMAGFTKRSCIKANTRLTDRVPKKCVLTSKSLDTPCLSRVVLFFFQMCQVTFTLRSRSLFRWKAENNRMIYLQSISLEPSREQIQTWTTHREDSPNY